MKTCDDCNSDISNEQVYCNKCGHKVNPSLLDSHVTLYTDIGKGLKIPFNPITFDYCYQIGASAYTDGNYYEALEYFNHAIAFHDVNLEKLSEVYTEIGNIYKLTGKSLDEYVHYYELGISSNPKNEIAYINLISSKVSIDDNGALEDFKKMVSVIHNFNPRFWHLAGMACENLHRYEAAKKFYEESINRGYEIAKKDLEDVVRKINKMTM